MTNPQIHNILWLQWVLANTLGAAIGWYVGGNLRQANLSKANLSGAVVTKANLSGANLSDVALNGTDLQQAIYDPNTIWQGAYYDQKTKFPQGFSPNLKKQMRLRRLN